MHTPRVFNFYYLCIISEIIARLFFFWFLYIILYKIDKRKTIKVNESIRLESHSCHFLLLYNITSSVGMYTFRTLPDIPKYSFYNQVTNFTGKTNAMSDVHKTFIEILISHGRLSYVYYDKMHTRYAFPCNRMNLYL